MILPVPLANAARVVAAWFKGAVVGGGSAPDTGTPVVLPTGFTAAQLAKGDEAVADLRAGVATDLEVLRAAAILAAAAGDRWHNVGGAGEPAFAGAWAHYNTTTHARVGFRADGLGRVQLKGSAAGTTVPSTLFTLPFTLERAVLLEGGRIGVSTAGVVSVLTGSASLVPLDGLGFSIVDT